MDIEAEMIARLRSELGEDVPIYSVVPEDEDPPYLKIQRTQTVPMTDLTGAVRYLYADIECVVYGYLVDEQKTVIANTRAALDNYATGSLRFRYVDERTEDEVSKVLVFRCKDSNP